MSEVKSLFDRRLGFGCMRLPVLSDGSVDKKQFSQMIDTYLKRGFRYFDTAYMYVNHESETALKTCLVERYPRDSFMLATKMPLMSLKEKADLDRIFNEQLAKTGVSFFDLYLLHNVNKKTIDIVNKTDAFEYLKSLKASGKAKHIGFSFHDTPELLDKILTDHPEIEFVQIQLNYYDWDSEDVQSRKCYEVLCKHNKPIIVMEPVKGGSLVNLPLKAKDVLSALDKNASTASYAIRFAASQPQVMVVLSGMSDINQLEDNTGYMQNFKPLTQEELNAVFTVRDILKEIPQIPCTSCHYCTEGCPMQINIPEIFKVVNNYRKFSIKKDYDRATKNGGKASDCVECGQCENACPQHILIRDFLKEAKSIFE